MSNYRVHIEAEIEMEERLKNIFYYTKRENLKIPNTSFGLNVLNVSKKYLIFFVTNWA